MKHLLWVVLTLVSIAAAAQTPPPGTMIPSLPPAAALSGTDLYMTDQLNPNGTYSTRRSTLQQIITFGGGGAGGGVGGAVVTPSASTLAAMAIPAAVTVITVQKVTGSAFVSSKFPTCPMTYLKQGIVPTGVVGEVLNTPSATYWEPQYQTAPVLACQFGAWGDNSHDDTVALQTMIDWGFGNGSTYFQLSPGGVYLISSALFLDPPGNLRSNLANPTNFSFAATLSGGMGPGDVPGNQIATLQTTFATSCALWIGPGQGMEVSNLRITGPTPGALGNFRGLPQGGISYCVAGGNGGASRTLLDNVTSRQMYTGIEIGANGNFALGDSNTIRKCNIVGAVAINFTQFNNLINRVDECVVETSTGIIASNFNGPTVSGGNYSVPSLAANTYTATGITSATAFQAGGQTTFQITVTVPFTNADAFLRAGNIYNGYAIVTPDFGVIPMDIQSYNTATNTGTFIVLDTYASFLANNGFGVDPATNSNLIVEINAATTVYAAERNIIFVGEGFNVNGIHIENGNVPTTLYQDGANSSALAGAAHNEFKNLRFNGDWANGSPGSNLGAQSAAVKAQYYVGRAYPGLKIKFSEVLLDSITNSVPTQDAVIIDCSNPECTLTGRGSLPSFQSRIPINAYPFTNAANVPELVPGVPPAFGPGTFWDGSPFVGTQIQAGQQGLNRQDAVRSAYGQGRCVMYGVRPAPWCSPAVTPAQLAVINCTPQPTCLPAIPNPASPASVSVDYPLLWGGQVYRLADWFFSPFPTQFSLVSNHHFYTLGQSLPTTNWHYIGQSNFLYVNDTRLFFPGLGVVLPNPSGGNQVALVTGVYPVLGYVTVLQANLNGENSSNGPFVLSGVKTTIYTGTTVGQEPFTITRF
jgi:hypothetical protein